MRLPQITCLFVLYKQYVVITLMLIARPQQFDDECVASYLVRVSELNGFKHIGYMLQSAGLKWKNNRAPVHDIIAGKYDLARIYATLGLTPFPIKTASHYSLFRRVVDTPHVFVRTPRVCPQCLEEDGYCHDRWAYLPIVACSKHGCMLVDSCSETENPLSWYRTRVRSVRRGSLVVGSKAEQGALELSAFFEDVISNGESSGGPPFNGLGLRETLSILHFICRYQSRLKGKRFTPVDLKVQQLAEVYSEAWVVLMNWPEGFYDLLDQYKDAPMSKKGVSGLSKHFRDLRDALHRQRQNKGIQVIRREFDLYIRTRWPGYVNTKTLSRIDLGAIELDAISRLDASQILKCRPARVSKLVEQGKLSQHKFKGKVHYSRQEVERLATLLLNSWSMVQAYTELGLSRFQLKQLLDLDVIRCMQKPDKENRDWFIDKGHCEAFVRDLLKSGARSEITDGISMAGVQRNGYSVVQLVEGMLSGTIQYNVKPDENNPYSFKQFVNFRIEKAKKSV